MKQQNNRKRRLKVRKSQPALSKGPRRKVRITRTVNVPRTAKQFSKLSAQAQDRWIRVTHAVSKMRADRVSLLEASREFGLDPRLVACRGKSALRKRRNGSTQRNEPTSYCAFSLFQRQMKKVGNAKSRYGIRSRPAFSESIGQVSKSISRRATLRTLRNFAASMSSTRAVNACRC